MDSRQWRDTRPQQYENILLPLVVTTADSAESTPHNANALNNNAIAQRDTADTDDRTDTRCSSPSMRSTCDSSNDSARSTRDAFTAIEQNDEVSEETHNRRLVLPGIGLLNLDELVRSRDAMRRGDARNNNARRLNAAAAATRLPLEDLVVGSSFVPSAFPSLHASSSSSSSSKTSEPVENNASDDDASTSTSCPAAVNLQCNSCQKKKKPHSMCSKACNKDNKSKRINWGLRLGTSTKAKKFSPAEQPQWIAEAAAKSALATAAVNATSPMNNNGLIFLSIDDDSNPFSSRSAVEDSERGARLRRAIEIEKGVEAPPGFVPTRPINPNVLPLSSSIFAPAPPIQATNAGGKSPEYMHMVCATDNAIRLMLPNFNIDAGFRIHSQVDYMHCLVRDLDKIFRSSFYFGKLDRFEAERLLDGKEEGSFLLRDSAQEDFLFSVSFRKYNRSLHARIEQFNHNFSFDCHDPGVFTSPTVTGLLEHYKDPACVLFFEPALTLPLNRKNPFSLQQLCRAAIVGRTTYDGINTLNLPSQLKAYLKEYHYKQRVRVTRKE